MKILNKKNINLVQAILLAFLLFMYIFGKMFRDSYAGTEYCSLFSLINHVSFIHYVFLLIVFANIVMCLSSAFLKKLENEKDDKSHTIIAIIIVLLLWFIGLFGGISGDTNPFNYTYLYSLADSASILLVISMINIALSMLKRSKLIVKDNSNKTNTVNNSIDDLKKYKELLDQGIITQEEFDTKKKEILK